MAGNVKVGGNVIATHTGTEGAGTVTLSNVTASALKMSSSGNTITDSAGSAVLSESSGTVNINKGTLGSSVVFPAGHPILLSTSESTSAVTSVEFNNSVITSTYKHYILRIHTIIPATDLVTLNLAFSTDNGSSFKNAATGKVYSQVGSSGTGAESVSETAAGISFGTGLGNDADIGQSAEVSIFGSQDTNYNYFDVKGWISGKHGSQHYAWWTSGYVNHAKTAINFLKLSFSSGNIAKHNLNLYGIK